jgi:hypothetical protein
MHSDRLTGTGALERLLRDLRAAGALDPTRPTARERLAAELGDELLEVVRGSIGDRSRALLAPDRRVA